jgi:hypothetical protein
MRQLLLKAGYKVKELIKNLKLSSLNIVKAGTLDVDGDVRPSSEPVLVKVEKIAVTTTTGNPETIIADLATWLNVLTTQLKYYYFMCRPTPLITTDLVTDDDVRLGLGSSAGTIEYAVDFTWTGYGSSTALNFIIPGDNTERVLMYDFLDWGAGETMTAWVTVKAYKYPEAIVP